MIATLYLRMTLTSAFSVDGACGYVNNTSEQVSSASPTVVSRG